MSEPEYVSKVGPGVFKVDVWVQPGAKKNELDGLYQERLKLRLRAPAVDNKANKALVAFVADILGLKKSQVSIVGGEKSRRKTLRVESDSIGSWPKA
jgi:hypothetical protein